MAEIKDVEWNISTFMNALQLSDVKTAFTFYVKPLLNTYVPDLKGILIRVDNNSLRLKSSDNFGGSREAGNRCFIQFHPLYATAKVNFTVKASILCPSVGQQVEAEVRAVKRDRIVCRFGDNYAIFVGVPTQGNEGKDTVPLDPQTGDRLKVSFCDKVQLEITKVNLSSTGDVLRLSGRILSLVSRKNKGEKKVKPFPTENAIEQVEEEAVPENVEVEVPPTKKKKQKKKKHTEEQEPQIKVSEDAESEEPPKKKKRKSKEAEVEGDKKGKKVRKNAEKKKISTGSNLLLVKSEALEDESFFQPAASENEIPQGMQSPDIFSSDDEEKSFVKTEAS